MTSEQGLTIQATGVVFGNGRAPSPRGAARPAEPIDEVESGASVRPHRSPLPGGIHVRAKSPLSTL